NGDDGICGNGDDSGVSGDGGGVVKARSLSTSSLGGSDMCRNPIYHFYFTIDEQENKMR
ncbi:hypothetical protein Tco_0510282, partial [Tanacetum coccineum]